MMGAMKVMRVRPSGRQQATGKIFRGRVLTQDVLGAETTDQHRVLEVTFTAGARTKLHVHTTDQVLVITAGDGVVGTPEESQRVSIGDVVFIPTGEPHYHGAAEGADMTHYSVLGANTTTVLE